MLSAIEQAGCPGPRCDLEGFPESEEFFKILCAVADGQFEDDLDEEDLDNGDVSVVSEDILS